MLFGGLVLTNIDREIDDGMMLLNQPKCITHSQNRLFNDLYTDEDLCPHNIADVVWLINTFQEL